MKENFYQIAIKNGQLPNLLLRDALLPEILGNDNQILYWAGKALARKFPLFNFADIPTFFAQAGWGDLRLYKANKNRKIYQLSGANVKTRLEENKEAEFLLEAGFLSESIQTIEGYITETEISEVNLKKHVVTLSVQSDHSEILDFELDSQPNFLELIPEHNIASSELKTTGTATVENE
ncbi:YslB family protein [Ligilactobacillus equi]|uniref:DUF2507 domain-containing protein n=1 Tax=Ligilactobacillus equi DSM 15833 = JCM 10991 TaxID=1423740 RepID=A0A0R1TDZ4_9LACO|nr:YslB family protein [Ligilactobacillus equi]KRL79360.1 hypothetical protein FC36_GL000534 [Ligilactobacillus equi DSM 15833 = JCM 10991]